MAKEKRELDTLIQKKQRFLLLGDYETASKIQIEGFEHLSPEQMKGD